MAKKAATKTLRPSADPTFQDPKLRESIDAANRELGTSRPAAAGGETNLAGSDLTNVGREYVDFMFELAELEDKTDRLKAKMKHREEWMLEQMKANGCDRITVAGLVNSRSKKTLYLNPDTIVSRAKGIEAEELLAVLRTVRLGELIGESVNANTLKATVKQQIATAELAEAMGDRGYCQKCSTFYTLDKVGTDCPECTAPGFDSSTIIKTIDGVPETLRNILYIEKKYKLGAVSV